MLRLGLRSLAINVLSVYVCIQVLSDVVVYIGGLKTLIIAAAIITVANLIVRPVINLLLLPLHLLTLGIFRWVANLATLYLVTWLVPNLQIRAFYFTGLNLQYLIVPPLRFSAFGAFILTTLVFTLIFHLIYWLFQD